MKSRGLILTIPNRHNFPFPPGSEHVYEPGDEFMSFINTVGPRTDDNAISIPLHIIAPEFIHSPDGGQFHAWTSALPESTAIGSAFTGMFETYARAQPVESPAGFVDACMSSALYHEDARNTVILVTTYRGRVLVISPDTSIKDVIAGSQWPKIPGSMEFTDKTKARRCHDFEFDGIELLDGWYVDVYLFPKKCLHSQ